MLVVIYKVLSLNKKNKLVFALSQEQLPRKGIYFSILVNDHLITLLSFSKYLFQSIKGVEAANTKGNHPQKTMTIFNSSCSKLE